MRNTHNCDASLYVPAVGAGGKIFIRLLRGWKTVCEHVCMCIFVMGEKVQFPQVLFHCDG